MIFIRSIRFLSNMEMDIDARHRIKMHGNKERDNEGYTNNPESTVANMNTARHIILHSPHSVKNVGICHFKFTF